jgi:hypothetical protein
MPAGLPVPGLQLPKYITSDNSELARFPRLPISLIVQNGELQISVWGIPLTIPITGQILLDGTDLSTLSVPLSLGGRARHELVFTCR